VDLTEISGAVLEYCAADGVLFTDDLNQVEQSILVAMRRIGAKAIELHLARRKLGYEGVRRPCDCGSMQRFVEHRPKQIATQMGTLFIRRAYYRCRHCGRSALPYDRRVGLGRGPESVGLAQAATLLGIHDTFASASETLRRLTGQRLSASTIMRLSESVGQVAAEQETQQAAAMADWQSPAAEATPDTLYATIDGVQVHQQDGWHEAKCVACYEKDGDGRTKNRETHYAVRFENAAAFVGFVWSLACRRGLEQAKRVVLLGDGAAWIWKHVGGLLKEAVCIVDWYHAMEHVWACGRVLHGEGTSATSAWVKEIEALLWEGQVRAILERLRGAHARTRAKGKRAALTSLITYIENQDDRMAYDRFRAAGLDIGSGRVESA